MSVLVDSDILIEVSRGRDASILQQWEDLSDSPQAVLCTPVSVAELWHGALPRDHEALGNLFQALVCVPMDAAIGRQAGEYLKKYHKTHGLELGDALIAAAAVIHRALLWSRNRKHYPMPDLRFHLSD